MAHMRLKQQVQFASSMKNNVFITSDIWTYNLSVKNIGHIAYGYPLKILNRQTKSNHISYVNILLPFHMPYNLLFGGIYIDTFRFYRRGRSQGGFQHLRRSIRAMFLFITGRSLIKKYFASFRVFSDNKEG
ncbi:hypothetical protein ACJX0J_038879, partial [Zea mays]